jgi:hypothetical protein
MADVLREPTRTAADEPRLVEPPVPAAPALAAKADDLEALRSAVIAAAGVSFGLWVSYLFVLFYLLVAAGGVTHRDLFFESPVRLPFLNVDLPFKGFFWLGPALFLIVHTYVLLHFVMLAGKVGCSMPSCGRRSKIRKCARGCAGSCPATSLCSFSPARRKCATASWAFCFG